MVLGDTLVLDRIDAAGGQLDLLTKALGSGIGAHAISRRDPSTLPWHEENDAVRLNRSRAAPGRWALLSPGSLRNRLFRNLGERVLLQLRRVGIEFANAFREFVRRHGVFVVHPAERFFAQA